MRTLRTTDFAKTLAMWCRRHHVVDCTFYSCDEPGVRYYWQSYGEGSEDKKTNIKREEGKHYKDHFWSPYGTTYADTIEFLAQEVGEYVKAGHVIGFSTEGALNHAIHYGSDPTLLASFKAFLAKHGYALYHAGNVFNLIYRTGDWCFIEKGKVTCLKGGKLFTSKHNDDRIQLEDWWHGYEEQGDRFDINIYDSTVFDTRRPHTSNCKYQVYWYAIGVDDQVDDSFAYPMFLNVKPW